MQNEKRFVLFPNNYKTKDTQPDFTGEITIDDVTYKLSGWQRTKADGSLTYLSGQAQLKIADTEETLPSPKPKPSEDDGIPF